MKFIGEVFNNFLVLNSGNLMYSEHIHPVKGDKIPQVVSPRA